MALQFSYTSSFGFEAPTCYVRVCRIVYDNMIKEAQIKVCLYKDSDSRLAGKEPFEIRQLYIHDKATFDAYFDDTILTLAGATVVSKCYDYLKTLAEYPGAIDC